MQKFSLPPEMQELAGSELHSDSMGSSFYLHGVSS